MLLARCFGLSIPLGAIAILTLVFGIITPSFAQTPSGSERRILDGAGLATLLRTSTGNTPEGPAFSFSDANIEPGRAKIRYLVNAQFPLEIVLVNRSSSKRAFKESASFKIYYAASPKMSAEAEATYMKSLSDIIHVIANNDDGTWIIESHAKSGDKIQKGTQTQGSSMDKPSKRGMTAHLYFGFLLLIGALLWLPTAIKAVWQNLQTQTKGNQIALGSLLSTAAFIRWVVVPHLVVTMYMGFKLADRATHLQEHFRYGVGAQVMWHGLFQFTGADHAHMIALNTVLAILSLLWLIPILMRAGFKPSGLIFTLALLAFMPMNIWSDASDSLTVPVLFWTLGATLFAQRALDHGRMWDAWGAILWLGMAAHTRPEHLLFGPLFVCVVLAFQSGNDKIGERIKKRSGLWLMAGLGYLAVCLPQILHALQMRRWMIETDGWPHKWWEIIPDLPALLSERNALLDPNIAPTLVLPFAFLGLFFARNKEVRRLRVGLFFLGLMWMSFYYIDLSIASLPRLHVVMLVPCLIIIGDLLSDIWSWRDRYNWAGPLLCFAIIGSLASSIPQSASWLWQETNERQEEEFYRSAVAKIPNTSFILVHSMEQDNEPQRYTHQHYPDYLLGEKARVMSIRDFESRPIMPGGPVYYYQGMRCYSRFRKEAEAKPKRYILPGCHSMKKRYHLEPVIEQVVPNLGDLALLYYSEEPEYRLGLYRIKAKK